jgi:hypothetical protein
MKKLYVIAALLMATTSAHAGGMTLQINGERIRVEAPRNCNALSCIRITAPGYSGTLGNIDLKGLGSTRAREGLVADASRPRRNAGRTRAGDRCLHLAGASRSRPARPASGARHGGRARTRQPAGAGCGSDPGQRDLATRHLGHRGQQGQRSHRGMRRQPVRLCRQHQ